MIITSSALPPDNREVRDILYSIGQDIGEIKSELKEYKTNIMTLNKKVDNHLHTQHVVLFKLGKRIKRLENKAIICWPKKIQTFADKYPKVCKFLMIGLAVVVGMVLFNLTVDDMKDLIKWIWG